jgi:hypothetical protein
MRNVEAASSLCAAMARTLAQNTPRRKSCSSRVRSTRACARDHAAKAGVSQAAGEKATAAVAVAAQSSARLGGMLGVAAADAPSVTPLN